MSIFNPAESIAAALFDPNEPGRNVYAVLDGATIEELLPNLATHKPQHVCLYRGELEPDLAMCAPYLVRLEAESAFTQWVLEEGWCKHWGIFATAPESVSFRDLRKHFRTFLVVKNTEGKSVYFRYYDPRVLRAFLPACNGIELRTIVGPLSAVFVEDVKQRALVCFSSVGGQIQERVMHRESDSLQDARA